MENQNIRTEILLGESGVEKLNKSKVIIYGLGGVGSYVVEALARAGIGHLVIIDYDKFDETNINRQIGALHSTIGKYKIDVMEERILDINPNIKVQKYFPTDIEGGEENLITSDFTYVVDAIDTITSKLKVIEKCNNENVKIITATGAGNKLDPTKFEVADIYQTSVCPVCKLLRKELKSRNINNLKVVYSKEKPIKHEETQNKILGSISFVPSVAGLIIAGEVIKDLIN